MFYRCTKSNTPHICGYLSNTFSYRLHHVFSSRHDAPPPPRCVQYIYLLCLVLQGIAHPLSPRLCLRRHGNSGCDRSRVGVRDEHTGVNGQVSHMRRRGRRPMPRRALLSLPLPQCAPRQTGIVFQQLTSNQQSFWLRRRILLCLLSREAVSLTRQSRRACRF